MPETLNIVAFLHRCGQHGSALCLLFITKCSEMLSNPASYGYTAPFCWILYFPLVPKSSQQTQNIHHLHFSPLLLCFHAIIGPFVEIIQTTDQNWRLWKLIWMERRAGLVDSVSVTALANVKQICLFFFIKMKFRKLQTRSKIIIYMKRGLHLRTVIQGQKQQKSFFSITFIYLSLSSWLIVSLSSGVRTSGTLNWEQRAVKMAQGSHLK